MALYWIYNILHLPVGLSFRLLVAYNMFGGSTRNFEPEILRSTCMLEFTVFTLWKFSEAMHFASYLLLLFQEFCLFTLQSAIYQPQLLLVSLEIVKFQLSDLIELCLFPCVIVSALILSWLGVMSPPQSSSSIYFKNFCLFWCIK